MFDSKTKKIAISAMLVALSFVYVLAASILRIDIGVWSFTPFSHIFIMLGTFISPFVGIFSSIGVFFSFLISTPNYFIWLRAGSHIFFVLALIFLLKKIKVKNRRNLLFIAIAISIVHAIFEIGAVYLGIAIGFDLTSTGDYSLHVFIWLVVGIGTFIHSMIDFYAALGVFRLLKKAHVIDEEGNTSLSE